jgi:hypothetical protein
MGGMNQPPRGTSEYFIYEEPLAGSTPTIWAPPEGTPREKRREYVFGLLSGLEEGRMGAKFTFGQFSAFCMAAAGQVEGFSWKDSKELILRSLALASRCACENPKTSENDLAEAALPLIRRICGSSPYSFLGKRQILPSLLFSGDITVILTILKAIPSLGLGRSSTVGSLAAPCFMLTADGNAEVRIHARKAFLAVTVEGNPFRDVFGRGNAREATSIFISGNRDPAFLADLWKVSFIAAVRGSMRGMEIVEAMVRNNGVEIGEKSAVMFREEALDGYGLQGERMGEILSRSDWILEMVRWKKEKDKGRASDADFPRSPQFSMRRKKASAQEDSGMGKPATMGKRDGLDRRERVDNQRQFLRRMRIAATSQLSSGKPSPTRVKA